MQSTDGGSGAAGTFLFLPTAVVVCGEGLPSRAAVLGLVKGGLMIATVAWALAWVSKDGRAMIESSPVAKVDLYAYQWISHFLPEGWEDRVRKAIP